MATPITIGSAGGEYMEAVVILEWAVTIGDPVKQGDLVVTVETAKAATEIEAPCDGVLSAVFADVGAEVPVSEVLGLIGSDVNDAEVPGAPLTEDNIGEIPADGGAVPGETAGLPFADPNTRIIASPAARVAAAKEGILLRNVRATSPTGRIKLRDLDEPTTDTTVRSSPLARRIAGNSGVDISTVAGTGPRGRVVRADVEKAMASSEVSDTDGLHNARTEMFEEGTFQIVPADGMRKAVASRLTEAKRDVPHFYLTADVKLDALLSVRTELNAMSPTGEDGRPVYKLSLNDFMVKGWAMALQLVPQANATWAGDAILLHHHSDVAVAVAIPGGLFTPIIRRAETKSLRQISGEVKDFAARAKERRLSPNEYTGGSSTISNLGMYGVKHFTSIINPPHGTIISIGAGEERVYPENGEVKLGTIMTISLSCDHRSVDGALGAQLMAAFKSLIEQPVTMLA